MASGWGILRILASLSEIAFESFFFFFINKNPFIDSYFLKVSKYSS